MAPAFLKGVQTTYTPDAPANRARILVVDDDPKLSRLVKLVLERTKLYEVLEENHSSRALAVARTFDPQAILLDVDMPGKDGGEVARELQGDPRLAKVPVMFLTSLVAGSEADEHEIERGGRLFLAKPTAPMVLLDAVGRLLNSPSRAA
jgi:CheY-like chemotaxis protein